MTSVSGVKAFRSLAIRDATWARVRLSDLIRSVMSALRVLRAAMRSWMVFRRSSTQEIRAEFSYSVRAVVSKIGKEPSQSTAWSAPALTP